MRAMVSGSWVGAFEDRLKICGGHFAVEGEEFGAVTDPLSECVTRFVVVIVGAVADRVEVIVSAGEREPPDTQHGRAWT